MKPYFKLLMLILTLSFLLSAFAGCENAEEEIYEPRYEDDDTASFFPDVEKNDYGLDFSILASSIGSDNRAGVGIYYQIDEDENSGSPIDEAVYARQDKVERYLGIDILKIKIVDDNLWRDIGLYIQNAVQSMDGSIDLGYVGSYSSSCVSNNTIQDFGELDGLDLDAEYWNKGVMESLEINGGMYLGISDFTLIDAFCVSFNKEMLALYESSLDKSIYDTVRDYEWTFEKMIEIASLVYIDKTGNGKTEDDIYGIRGRCWHPFCGFMPAADIPTMVMDETGSYSVSVNQSRYFQKADDLVEMLRDLRDSNASWFHYQPPNDTGEVVKGKCLMFLSETKDLETYLMYDAEFGVLPYPMYDTAQAKTVGYQTLNWGGFLAVPSYLKNTQMVEDTLELLAFYSANVTLTYYEKLLGKQVADMPDDADMLDLIWDGATCDVGFAYIDALGLGTSGLSYMVAELVKPESTQNLSSYINSKAPTANASFRRFVNGARN